MCGRTRCTLNPDRVARACGFAASIPTRQIDRYRPSYNVSPGAYLPVLLLERTTGEAEASPSICCMKWGLVPSFTKKTEKPDHYKMFNARSESVKEKPSFCRLLPTNRCVVAVEGFYEWKKDASKKQPYYIHFKDSRPLVFAALYDSWKSSEGDILYTFTILTVGSSKSLQWLHDRMPVILGDDVSVDVWLNNGMPKSEIVLRPYEDEDLKEIPESSSLSSSFAFMVWYPVTTAVGKPSFDGPDCITEIKLKRPVENQIAKFFTKKADGKNQMEEEHTKRLELSPKGDRVDDTKKDASRTENVANFKEESPQNDMFNCMKEDCEHHVDEKHSSNGLLKKENVSPDIFGTKRQTQEIPLDSGSTSEKVSSLLKKARRVKNVDDKQASLLSYFGKA
ncbi:hypothetical protein ZIOFF_000429 [Zingiber officinale]|uniref:Embryonic stem cell-specific 5-hydroxymethylcytosine-binding protein n=1 Tax=Zingiber officinale TaxID=94328 RepID=A0A8J5LXW9_ZINOF|nr:hypothetical protein ZIOFF_000429 [Zingiber officinale]